MSEPRRETHPWRKDGPRPITAEEAEEIDRTCDRFESAWRRGEAPRHEDFLRGDGPFRDALRAELIAIELEWLRSPGAVPVERAAVPESSPPTVVPGDWDEYRTRVPSVLESIALASGPLPRVLLRDTDGGPEPPLHRPTSGDDSRSGTRFRIDGEIARGGMGSVLKGRDPDLGRDVALKVLREDFLGNAEMVRRFVEEAQIGGQLQHPGIVPIYEMGTFHDLRPFFSMKLVKGDTLAKLLAGRKNPGDGLPRFLSIFEAIAQTVAYAHARGVIHRDLKPSNVMVGSFGEVQVMDWGLAKVLARGGVADDATAGRVDGEETVIATARSGSDDSDLSRAGSVMGTPSYMAPEQARGEIDQIDERADVFALGSILCEVLTGRPAFTGRHPGEIQRKAAMGDLADALARLDASGADAELIAMAKECLATEPEDRPGSAGAVSDRVTAYLAGVQERLRRAELERVEERARRRLTTLAATALILMTLLGGGGYAWVERQKADRLARTARAVEEALADAARLRGEARSAPPGDSGRWSAALSAAKRAEGLLAEGEAAATLRDRVRFLREGVESERSAAAEKARQIEIDRVLLGDLETVRGKRVQHRDPYQTDAEYAEVFRKAGLDLDSSRAEEAGKWLASRTDPVEMAGYLDDWAFARRSTGRPEADWRRLVNAARRGDPEPWRDTLRVEFASNDPDAVAEFRRMADDPKLEDQSTPGLLLLARQLKYGCGDNKRAAQVLRRAAHRYPGDFRVHFELAQAPGTLEGSSNDLFPDPEEAVRHLASALGIRPQSVTTHVVLSYAWIAYRKLNEAEAVCREAVRLKPDDPWVRTALGNVLRWQGKYEEAVVVCREAIRLDPAFLPAHGILGLALSHLGRHDEAEVELRKVIRLKKRVPQEDYLSLASALQKKGDFAGALSVLNEAREQGVKFVPNFWNPAEWFVSAESMGALDRRLPAILKGEDRANDVRERLDLAQICYNKKLFSSAARFWGEALELDPKLGDLRQPQHRYNAACSASLASGGKGKDDPPPDDAARTRLRARALAWLRSELVTWAGYLESDATQGRPTVARNLSHWREDVDLAPVRDADALTKLPEGERSDWLTLWGQVDALMRKAGRASPR